MVELESDDHKVTQAEHEFYRSIAIVLEHLKNRALNAEAEVHKLRRERDVLASRIEYLLAIAPAPISSNNSTI